MNILLLTNPGDHSVPLVRALLNRDDRLLAVVSSSHQPWKGKTPLRLLREYGLPFLVSKLASRLVTSHSPASAAVPGATYITVPDINSPDSVARLSALEPDILLTYTFSQILSPPVLGIPRVAALNVHASLLPKYRGPHPVFWALYHGEAATGVTIHVLDPGIDSGPIVLQREIPVGPEDTISSLEQKLNTLAVAMVLETIDRYKTGTVSPVAPPERGPYYKRPRAEDIRRFKQIMKQRRNNLK